MALSRILPELFRDVSRPLSSAPIATSSVGHRTTDIEDPSREDPLLHLLRPPSYCPLKQLFQPDVDIVETDGDFLIEVDLPGLAKEDLEVELAGNNTLVIEGRVKPSEEASTAEKQGQHVWNRERSTGLFQRQFKFPMKLNKNDIAARYKMAWHKFKFRSPRRRLAKEL
ncbi:hypothetical protein BZG36_01457 [Bifiguratus adelaidae]|uniref:SHSP domain-containing protein n=1 Tax=Bifiguratus adelaidae TaxID=1938954 RepID=A0A261Y527_9FUNG|nr:hypothetical protein BZG36_01457 [Bifiguratus adelaidae]